MPDTNPDWSPEPALWTKKQTAAYLNVSERTVSNLLRMGQLVRRRIGARTLIPKTSVETFLRSNHPTETTEQKEQRQLRRERWPSRELKNRQETHNGKRSGECSDDR